VIAILLFFQHELAVAELAFHEQVRAFFQGRSKSGQIPPRYKLFKTPLSPGTAP
jgi:hypothetical protein